MKSEFLGIGCAGAGIVFLVSLFSFAGCDYVSSEGYRDGIVQKFSRQGVIFTSWEGELAQAGFRPKRESVSSTFEFSVDDQKVIDELKTLEVNVPVRLHYQRVLLNALAYHATSYRIVRIEILKQSP